MQDKNLWTGEGTLGADPEAKYTANGNMITKFRIACNKDKKQADGSYEKQEPDWLSVTAFKFQAKIAATLHKGDKVHIDARLTIDNWETPEGEKRSKPVLIANKIIKQAWIDFPDEKEASSRGGYGS